MTTLERGLTGSLQRLLDSVKVVVLEGGRSVGKTTLALMVARNRGFATFFDLSDPVDRAALGADAHGVLAASARPILIDEAQLEPEVTVAVKRLVDASPEPGQILLTGSSRIGRGALGGSDPLAGRAARLRLWSFTQSELSGRPVNVIDQWWAGELEPTVHPPLDLEDLVGRMLLGGLPPLALGPSGSRPSDRHDLDGLDGLLDAYVEGVLHLTLAGTRTNRERLLHAYRYLAANPGQILNLSRAASELGARAETVRGYVDLAETSFLLDSVPSLRPRPHKTLTAHPRTFTSDPALAGWAARATVDHAIRDPQLRGSLLENFVFHELAAQTSWSQVPSQMLHWRDTKDRREVDLVLRRRDGTMMGIEVKSAGTLNPRDAAGLRAFSERMGEAVTRCLIIYTGRTVTRLDDRTWAVPVAALF